MRPRLTIRGWSVVAVIFVAVAMSWGSGPRALNAVVVPLSVVLLAGLVAVIRTDRPRVDRQSVSDGFIGEQRRIEVDIESQRPVAASVHDTVGDGLSTTDEPIVETTLGTGETVSYDVSLEQRGERQVGPLSIAVRDILGLVERRFEYETTTPVLVYPHIRELGHGSVADLQTLSSVADRHDHEEFDHLREYRNGDPLRDVHWKSAAKRADDTLNVMEYADGDEAGAVTVAAECRAGRSDGDIDRGDEMAAAAASVATYLLELGAPVGIDLPDVAHPPGTGRTHHRELLRRLAVAEPGELPEYTRRDADVLVRTDADGTTILVDDREIPFGRLCGRDENGEESRISRVGPGPDDSTGRDTDSSPEVTA
ncbi:DUF58 domain-containing protein [Natrinema halophilum]|uniref:DUF58 domain-containing protein n=1 Tax=Natrinema halophilum TaxID=1699371 RepID=A0A7D5GLQ3_9EURY|nr:DUF58 domain-containing protein [Natrinema halophilum]QLG49532.1 DUF58 domain-containing protein [Natrinema halophilum]